MTAGDKEDVVDAAKTAFICRNKHAAADDGDASLGNGRHDNRVSVGTTSCISSAYSTNRSLIDSSDVPLTDTA